MSAIFNDTVSNELQSPIRIVAHLDKPLANECFDSYPEDGCLFPGYEIEYIYTVIHDMLRYPVQFLRVNNQAEIETALDEGRADIMGLSSFVNSKYSLRFGFPPEAFMYDSLALLVRESYTNQSQVLSLLKSFTWDLWSFIMVTTVVCLGIRYTSKIFHERTLNFLPVKQQFVMKTIKILLYKFRVNVIFSIWFILVSLLLNFYSNLIAVDLVAPDRVKTVPFKTLSELGQKLKNKECKLIVLESYADLSEINDLLINPVKSNRPWAPLFVEAFTVNPPSTAFNRKEMIDMVLNSSCNVGLDFSSMDLYYQTTYCDLRVLSYPEEIKLLAYTFYTTREDLSETMSTVISSESFQGYTSYLNDKYYKERIPVDCTAVKSIQVNPVNLKKIQDCFFVLAIGLVVALFITFIRNAIYGYKNRKTIEILKCSKDTVRSIDCDIVHILHITSIDTISL